MALEGVGLALAFVLVFAAPLVLYALMQRETETLPRMDREEAERRAKREGQRYNRAGSDERERERD